MHTTGASTTRPDPVRCHTLVIGAGPGGLLAAIRAGAPSGGVVVLDQGADIEDRIAVRDGGGDERQNITSGFGGAGLFSDGKLCLSHRIGSTVAHRFPPDEVEARQNAIDQLFRGGEDAPLQGADPTTAERFAGLAAAHGLDYLHYPVRHIGSDQLMRMTSRLRRRVEQAATVLCGHRCTDVRPSAAPGHRWEAWVLGTAWPEPLPVYADNIVLAPGKVGATWLRELGTRLDLPRSAAQPKLGFRLEGPRGFLDPLLAVATDPKVIWKAGPGGAEVRTHCVCFGGDVVPAAYRELTLVGGHSTSEHGQDRSNTAVLATAGVDVPLSAEQVRDLVARTNEVCGGRVMAQTLGDFLAGVPTGGTVEQAADGFRPSIPDAVTGNLAEIFPLQVTALLRDYLRRLAGLCPQVLRERNLLYGPAVERWSDRFEVTDTMQSPGRPGLYLVGDGPGLTGGIIGAAESGWLAGDAIAAALHASV
ncbi:FAD-dependent protein [Streptacidiphilus sp. EB103A]|uniref:FAD-dependent protein n=1 Tax=Streptacidiphilus sp. EB103A TaxID=3156275 RepID=UPI0035127118